MGLLHAAGMGGEQGEKAVIKSRGCGLFRENHSGNMTARR
jgi:hypothetical protein